MPRIRTDPVEVAVYNATQTHPLSPQQLKKIENAACKLPPVPKAAMNGNKVSFGADEWLKVSAVAPDCTIWGPSPDYDTPGARNVAKAKLEVGPEFAEWFMGLWTSIQDAIVEGVTQILKAGGTPNISKSFRQKFERAKTAEEKRTIVTEAYKIHNPLTFKGDGEICTLATKVRLLGEGEPGENDARTVKSFPPLTQEEFKKGGLQVIAKPMKALDGTTSIPLDRVLEPVQGRPIFVGQVRFDLLIKSSIILDGGKRICVLPMSIDFQLLSMKQSDAGRGEAMPNLADL